MTSPQPRSEAVHRKLLLLAAVGFSAFVYYPITRNYFYADDFLYLFQINNVPLLEFLLTPNGGHAQFARNLLFYLSYRSFGLDPHGYMWLALLTHLINVALLFRLILYFTGSARLACFGGMLWGTSPLSDQTLGWYSVYGQVVVATLILLVLVRAARAAETGRPIGRAEPYLWYLALVVASICFGVGTALALVAPLVLYLVYPALFDRRAHVVLFASLLIAVPVLYVALARLYDLVAGAASGGASMFLMAALRRWPEVLRMLATLFSSGLSGTALGWLDPTSTSYRLWTYCVLAAYAAGSAVLLFSGSTRGKRLFGACIVLAVSGYAIIALGRALVYAKALTATGATSQPRYHYVTSVALVVSVCLILSHVARWAPFRRLRNDIPLLAWVAMTLFFFMKVEQPIDHHDAARHDTLQALDSLHALFAQPGASDAIYVPNRTFPPVQVAEAIRSLILERAPEAAYMAPMVSFPGWAGVFITFFPENVVGGKHVYFVEADARAAAAVQARPDTRAAALIVTPGRDRPPL